MKKGKKPLYKLPALSSAELREESPVYYINGNGSARVRIAPPPITRLVERKKLIPFGWYGGKFSHLDWLLPLLPHCHHYCEPFAGSGAVLLNREPSPVETFNDIDGEVVNFFRVLREEKEELIEAIGLTPFAREEFSIACEVSPICLHWNVRDGFMSAPGKCGQASRKRQRLAGGQIVKNTSRAGMSGVVSRWLGAVEDLPAVAERLLRVQIENRPAIDVIRLYDSPTTLFYCDPPYVHSTRGDSKAYSFEMTDAQHRELAKVLNSVQGMVAFSNYPAGFIDELYPAPKWHKTVTAERTNHSTKDKRVEVLWTNYDPHKIKHNGKHHGELFPTA